MSFIEKYQKLYMLLMIAGLAIPFLTSLWMTFTAKSPELKDEFLARLFNPRLIRVKMLPALFLLMPASVILSIILSMLVGESAAQFQLSDGFSFSSGFVPVLVLLMMTACFEELGWRGYAFDSLLSRHSFGAATIIFSVLWSLWHFPLIFVNESYQYIIFHENFWYGINFFVGIVPMGIILSWFCAKNNKSIIAAVFFHIVINMSQEALMITQTTKCIQTLVLTIFAIVIMYIDREMFFSGAVQPSQEIESTEHSILNPVMQSR
jgi:hypothetical protein